MLAKFAFKDIDVHAFGNTIQLVGAIYQGEGKTMLAFFPEDFYAMHGPERTELGVLPLNQADWDALVRQTDLLETEVLAQAKNGPLTKIIIRKSTRHIDQNVSWNVYRRDGYACRYCAKNDIPLTVDHLVLYEEGGPAIEANLVSACKKCNRLRGRMQYPAWIGHPYYREVSKRLTPETRLENERLILTLDTIPRRLHIATR